MSDTFKYNRDLLGTKKSARERQKDEIRIRSSNYEKVNVDYVKARVSAKLKRNRAQEIFSAFIGVLIIVAVIGGVIWVVFSTDHSIKKKPSSDYFNTIISEQKDGIELRMEYFPGGPKAAETRTKNGMKHQNSESFYPTGEQFRSALYYYDTLVREVYYFKSGDTIKNFPVLPDTTVGHITLRDMKSEKKIEFNFIDGKIIGETYRETLIPK